MELKLRCQDKIIQLLEKGVDIPNALSIDIGEEVNVDRISGNGVKIYPGCRIYGEKTVISEGARIGREGPVTIENCQVGPQVELKGGYFNSAVFLEKSSMGFGAHVREGCILEEQANGAHCVGLKQTILLPFVTLGSLINFCDCLMSGGTSRKNHSEVGSSYIHFNFTPDADKITPSLIGDVPRGVMLNQRPIFLGGQGGTVGPVRLGYGNVVSAGTILRRDYTEDNKLIIGKSYHGAVIDFVPRVYRNLSRIVENNILYMANLMALEQWYINIRRPFFSAQEFGELVYAGALDKLMLAKNERIKRLKAMADNMSLSTEKGRPNDKVAAARGELRHKIEDVCELFTGNLANTAGVEQRDNFLASFRDQMKKNTGTYIEVVQNLPAFVAKEGTLWLDLIVDRFCGRASAMLPLLDLFEKRIIQR